MSPSVPAAAALAPSTAPSLRALLACPHCGAELEGAGAVLRCAGCGEAYPVADGQPDLRPRRTKAVGVTVRVDPLDAVAARRRRPRPIPRDPAGVDADPAAWPGRLTDGNGLTRELLSWLPHRPAGGGVLLDLGCGSRRCEPALRLTGLEYVGVDVAGPAPDALAVGEALPFRDESFDAVFTLAVVPHAVHPALVMREIRRVLRPGARYVGTAQFLEPCMIQSRHHVSALGIQDWLEDAGLELLHLEANARWLGMDALLRMGYFPRLSWGVNGALGRAIRPLHRAQALRAYLRPASNARYPLGEGFPERVTGGFRYVARRPAEG
jgi:SAM-dependent methyltransferase